MIRTQTVTVTGAVGGVGVSTASSLSTAPISGLLRAVHLAYTDSPPATTDVTIATKAAPTTPLLTVSDANTDGWFYPMAVANKPDASSFTDFGAPIPVDDHVVVTIAQANVGDGVVAILLYEV